MTVGSLREHTVRWLRVAALVVFALLALRIVTAPRAIVPVALAPVTQTDSVTMSIVDGEAVDDVVEARQIRRARPVQPGLLPHLAAAIGAAILAAAALARRHDPRIATTFASRAVPVLGGRAPPALAH